MASDELGRPWIHLEVGGLNLQLEVLEPKSAKSGHVQDSRSHFELEHFSRF